MIDDGVRNKAQRERPPKTKNMALSPKQWGWLPLWLGNHSIRGVRITIKNRVKTQEV
jgi:hypothetical protein